ncbi:hypothetical protein T03_11474 [Trichinella britovi]|uniref:Uncharacterized protein n=1 Tax=Trichinella britovi TaxID=45882 RepID=A0A0V1C8J7_TRIBR|nr:hypothetical protein T03_11474 [Trichinella britovi]
MVRLCQTLTYRYVKLDHGKHMTWWKNEEIKPEFYMYDVEHPKFSEKLLEFLSFWEQFTGGIHNNTEIADVTKFTYLRSLLEGEGLRTIDGRQVWWIVTICKNINLCMVLYKTCHRCNY